MCVIPKGERHGGYVEHIIDQEGADDKGFIGFFTTEIEQKIASIAQGILSNRRSQTKGNARLHGKDASNQSIALRINCVLCRGFSDRGMARVFRHSRILVGAGCSEWVLHNFLRD
jgi:hypothetical protein